MLLPSCSAVYFGKALSLNAVHCCIQEGNPKLYHAGAETQPSSLGISSDGPEDSGNVFFGQTSPLFRQVHVIKDKNDHENHRLLVLIAPSSDPLFLLCHQEAMQDSTVWRPQQIGLCQ